MRLAIIPARGGSKRIPRKNVRDFYGKPMLAWPIEAARESSLFDHIIVSSDDDDIMRCAQSWGAEAPFRRPSELADDFTPTRDVVNHAINDFIERHGIPDQVCCIYATAPFLRSTDLKESLKMLEQSKANFVFSATEFPFPIQRAFRRLSDGCLEMFQPEHRLTRSQDLEPAYHDAAQFYWGSAQAFLDGLPMFSGHVIPFLLPRRRVIDIDTPEDWYMAELLAQAMHHTREACEADA
jgi:pseudaminic acid cytidylyltransferase